MKIPPGMTEEQVLQVIEDVTNRYAYKFRFGYYDIDDIRQEAFIIALDALERYDGDRPLENFLSRHIRNRLITFVRDNYYRRGNMTAKGLHINEIKKRLIDTANIDRIDPESESSMILGDNLLEDLHKKDLIELIDQNIDPRLREDYLKLLDGYKLSKSRKEEIIDHIIRIISSRDGKQTG